MIEIPTTQPTSRDGTKPRRTWNRIMDVVGPFLAFAAVVLFFAIADRGINGEKATFLTSRNLVTISSQMATVAVAALGMTVIIIAGGIDLAAGTAIALCATVLAWSLKEDLGPRWFANESTASVAKSINDAKSDLKRIDREIEALAGGDLNVSQVAAKLMAKSDAEEALRQYERRLTKMKSLSAAVAVVMSLACGALCGFTNGLLVSYLRVVPFIVTLGTMQLYLGLSKQIARETTVRPDRFSQVSDSLVDLLSVRADALWLGLPSGVWLTLLLAALLAAVLHWTVFSRYVFALGSNEATARLCGINVRWNKIAVYTLSGLFVGIGGIYQFSRLTVGNPTSGTGLELRVIAAVVIGGASLSGGRGSVLGTLLGALIMSVIGNGCTMLGLENPVQDMILGVIIVAAVTLDQLRQRTAGGRQS